MIAPNVDLNIKRTPWSLFTMPPMLKLIKNCSRASKLWKCEGRENNQTSSGDFFRGLIKNSLVWMSDEEWEGLESVIFYEWKNDRMTYITKILNLNRNREEEAEVIKNCKNLSKEERRIDSLKYIKQKFLSLNFQLRNLCIITFPIFWRQYHRVLENFLQILDQQNVKWNAANSSFKYIFQNTTYLF